ncbi:unnamed protein product (macronuclear) [Paramecium tetraurelia]|uniref:Casein kinase I n=1 Tax=Paramecium tetraurelia TaxID=5888 RepID=A0DVT7_PARTE|nr:uncharacterized protein GSPATT00020807001 [Paramecium tetraurelia]CAK87154.1 unnamed protein product [Paramecium tetraurelia]|eukprot:XP_001454551.1 hypothetical protein (macronuclear) [Paramecium tetraurelia strain d4-2]
MVYFAKEQATMRPVQLKISNFHNSHYRQRTLGVEVKILLGLRGIAGIPEIIDYGYTSTSKFYIVSEQTGHSLQQYIDAKKQLGSTTIIYIGQQLLGILERIHARNVYHTNLSPQNISILKNQVYLHGFYLNHLDDREKVLFKDKKFWSKSLTNGCTITFKDDLESLGHLLMHLVDYELNNKSNGNQGSNQSSIFFRSYFELLSKLQSTNPPPYLHLKKIIYRIITQCLSDENKIKFKQASRQLSSRSNRNHKNKLSIIKEDDLENIVSKDFVKINAATLFDDKINSSLELQNSMNQTFEISEEQCQLSEMIQNLHNQSIRARSIASLCQYKQ